MRLIVADTGPINYLVLIGHINLLPVLFETVILPTAVHKELESYRAPPAVRNWISAMPAWIEVHEVPAGQATDVLLNGIDEGERAAIQLAALLSADLLLMDDRKGVSAALRRGLSVTGTLGVLDLAAHRGIIDFVQAILRLRQTNFRMPSALIDSLLQKHGRPSDDG